MNIADTPEQEKAAQILVEAAVWAPSVHNTQPWWFGTRGATVTVHADAERRLDVADPDGREMLISCGAALYTLRLAARHLGRRPQVQVSSDPERPGLIADVAVGPPEPATDEERRLFAQIRRRRTHRGGFHPVALPPGLLQTLRTHAYDEGVMLRIVADPGVRVALAALTEAAEYIQRQNPAYLREIARWAPRPGSGHGWGLIAGDREETTGIVALLTTDRDGRADWLRAGQALQRVLLRAAEDEVSAAFHTQALEVPELRDLIRTRFCDGAYPQYPQMIVRLGVAGSEITSVRRSSTDLMRPEP